MTAARGRIGLQKTAHMLDSAGFARLWRRLGGHGDAGQILRDLMRAYAELHRAYHTATHIVDCLKKLDSAREIAERPDEVEAAIWFHDAVYNPKAGDNEQQSAKGARRALTDAGVKLAAVERIAALILLTRHVDPPQDHDGELLLDIDLSILGAEPDEFAEYDRQIRIEYNWVPEPEYRLRRAEILESFLQRPTIYRTPQFRERFQESAEINLRKSIDELRQRGGEH